VQVLRGAAPSAKQSRLCGRDCFIGLPLSWQ
jgi:hypothetical protein